MVTKVHVFFNHLGHFWPVCILPLDFDDLELLHSLLSGLYLAKISTNPHSCVSIIKLTSCLTPRYPTLNLTWLSKKYFSSNQYFSLPFFNCLYFKLLDHLHKWQSLSTLISPSHKPKEPNTYSPKRKKIMEINPRFLS